MKRLWPMLFAAVTVLALCGFLFLKRDTRLLWTSAASLGAGVVAYTCCNLRRRLSCVLPLICLAAFCYAQRGNLNAPLFAMLIAFALAFWIACWGFEALTRPWERKAVGRVPGETAARLVTAILLLIGSFGCLTKLPLGHSESGALSVLLPKLLLLMPGAWCLLLALQTEGFSLFVASFVMLAAALPAAMKGELSLLLMHGVIVFTGCLLRSVMGERRAWALLGCALSAVAVAPYWRPLYEMIQRTLWLNLSPVQGLLRGGLMASLFFGAGLGMVCSLMWHILTRHWGLGAPAWLILTCLPLLFLPTLRAGLENFYFLACCVGAYLAAWAGTLLFAKE